MRRVLVEATLATVMLLSVSLTAFGQAGNPYQITITPSSPIAGQPFEVSGLETVTSVPTDFLVVGQGSCSNRGTTVYSVAIFGYFTVSVPGQSAGNYYATITPGYYCTSFTITHIPVPPPTVSPNPAIVGQLLTFSGSVPAGTAGDEVVGFIAPDTSAAHDCSSFGVTILDTLIQTLSAGLTYSIMSGAGLSTPGFYCAGVEVVHSGSSFLSSFTSLSVTAAPPIPEYPFGLAVLTIFMIIAYGVIRRRTRNVANS